MKSTMKLKRLQYADKVSGTLKGSMFFLRSTQNLQKVFLSALALHNILLMYLLSNMIQERSKNKVEIFLTVSFARMNS